MALGHPYYYDGFLFLLNPATVVAGTLDTTTTNASGLKSGTSIYQYLFVASTSTGDLADIKEGMTILLGTTTGGDNYGRARVLGTTTVDPGTGPETVILVWASPNIKDGELYVLGTTYFTVLNDYRVWWKPPYYDDNGVGAYDGIFGPGGCTYSHVPIANAGPGFVDWVDSGTGLVTVTLDGSASFCVNPNAVLGTLDTDITGSASMSASTSDASYPLVNLTDNNAATTWAATAGTTTGWVKASFGAAQDVGAITIRANNTYGTTAPKDFTIEGSTNDSTWTVIRTLTDQTFSASEQKTYYLPDHTSYRYYKIDMTDNGGHATYLAIAELELLPVTSGTIYDWDVDDGSITVGTSTSESITATFPIGFRYVELQVTDSNGAVGKTYVPVAACGQTISGSETSYVGATKTASSTYISSSAANAFDNLTTSIWLSALTATTAWLKIQFTAAKSVRRYGVQSRSVSDYYYDEMPKSWRFEGSNDGSTWVTLDMQYGQTWSSTAERTFDLDTVTDYEYYRLYMLENNGGNGFAIGELNLYEASAELMPIQNFEVLNQRLTIEGQEISFRVHETIDMDTYPAGTLAMYWEREVIEGVPGSYDDAGPDGFEHIKFIGWLNAEPTTVQATDTDHQTYVDLQCVDVAGRLKQIFCPPVLLEREDSSTPAYSYQMTGANIDRFVYLLARWFSTAAQVADFTWSGTGDTYGFSVLASGAGTLWDVMADRTDAIGYAMTCNKYGQLAMVLNNQLLDYFSRSWTTDYIVSENNAVDLKYVYNRHPRYHWLWSNAIVASTTDADALGTIGTAFVVAPGEAPGQGANAIDRGEQLVVDADELKTREGNRYAMLNRYITGAELTLVMSADYRLDPATLHRISFDFSEGYLSQRGVELTGDFMLLERIIDHDAETKTKTVRLVLENITHGMQAVSYFP